MNYVPLAHRSLAADGAVPDAILKKIRNAWAAGAISTVVTLAFVLYSVFGEPIRGYSSWEFLDVALLAGLTFGIYKKSRVCAVLMVLYFVAAKIFLIAETGKASGLMMGFVFLYFYAYGAVGTFAFHKWIKGRTPAAERALSEG